MMIVRAILAGCLACFSGELCAFENGGTQALPDKLTTTQKRQLDDLLKTTLFDPKGRKAIAIEYEEVFLGKKLKRILPGWLDDSGTGKPTRVLCLDGPMVSLQHAPRLKELDFIARCRKTLSSGGYTNALSLVYSAWLYRLGQEKLAAGFLARAKDATTRSLRQELATNVVYAMFRDLRAGRYQSASWHGDLLNHKFATIVDKDHPQWRWMHEEIQRRKQTAPAKKLPRGFAQWPTEQKLSYLIDVLEDVDHDTNYDFIESHRDFRLNALIQLGEVAVPRLIEVIAQDERLSRSEDRISPNGRQAKVLPVRELARIALTQILKLDLRWETSPDFGTFIKDRGRKRGRQLATELRQFWRKFGRYPFDERMMVILTEKNRDPYESQQWDAVHNLVKLGEKLKPNPVIKKFKNPTVAEAILSSMDLHLAVWRKHNRDDPGPAPDYLVDYYLGYLIELGDSRIGPELAKRAKTPATPQMHRKWSHSAYLLGTKKPWKDFARQFIQGRTTIPNSGELLAVLSCLTGLKEPVFRQALQSVIEEKHAFHPILASKILDPSNSFPWFPDTFSLDFARSKLSNQRASTIIWYIDKEMLELSREGERFWGISLPALPKPIQNPKQRRTKASSRICDEAAMFISRETIGLPHYHVILKDHKTAFQRMVKEFQRYPRYRVLTTSERRHFGFYRVGPLFAPDVRPLNRPANPLDQTGLQLCPQSHLLW